MSTMTMDTMNRGAMRARTVTVGAVTRGAVTRGAVTGPARLTRRGRLLVTGLVALVLIAAAVLSTGSGWASAGTSTGTLTGTSSGAAVAGAGHLVTVRPGESLWQIAVRAAPGTDPRETVARILDLNGMHTSQIQAGTALRLP